MAETYEKINEDTLKITSICISQIERQQLEEEKQMAKDKMVRVQKWIDGIDVKLAVLGE